MKQDWEEKAESAMHKLREFADLGYPAQERVRACRVLARERDGQVWRDGSYTTEAHVKNRKGARYDGAWGSRKIL